jgi:hypothetical protein
MSNGVVFQAAEVSRSLEVFTDPTTYQGFDLTPDGRRMVVCLDPRDEEDQRRRATAMHDGVVEAIDRHERRQQRQRKLPVAVQTGGGASGKGVDSSLALTAFEGRLVTLDEGLRYDSELQRSTLAGAHIGCRFNMGIMAVVQEMIEPSDITNDTFRSLAKRYELTGAGIDQRRDEIRAAAELLLPQLVELTPEAILDTVNQLYPYHQNVVSMRGENRAGLYILNHHPYVGLNRNRVHRGNNPLVVQAYHDSVRATLDSLMGTVGMPSGVKELRQAALLARIAATRTILCADTPDMKYLNVVPTSRGIQIEQEYF